MDRERLLRRFLRYVRIDTTADDKSSVYPSSAGQIQLGGLLVDELREMGVADVEQDSHGIIMATLRGPLATDAPVVALNAHLDTSPETTGANVNPQVVRNYQGGDIHLPGVDGVIAVNENPELDGLRGCDLITTDGTTLLGADDKAGIAIIMELAQWLCESPEIKTAPIRILFTCDEEIGHGVDHVDLAKLNADVAYTVDGPAANQIDVETFSADMATIRIQGVNIHPAIAKDRMSNALKAAASLIAKLPRGRLSPETTDEKDGFLHPYQIEGGVAEVVVRVLLRDFETSALRDQAELLRRLGELVETEFPGTHVEVDVRRQYRNLGDGLKAEPRAVQLAADAHHQLGRSPKLSSIRGGTDGSLLTEKGLPTPNLSSGQHNPHSPLEWACLHEMVQAVELLCKLVQIWREDERSS